MSMPPRFPCASRKSFGSCKSWRVQRHARVLGFCRVSQKYRDPTALNTLKITQSKGVSAVPAAAEGGSQGGFAQEPPLQVDVAIFGAGPAGLTTALAMNKACPDLKVHVYERAKTLRPSGGSIGLFSDNIFKALDAIGEHVRKAVKGAGIDRRNMILCDQDGGNRNTRAVPATLISWFELQKALLSCLPSKNMVTLDCELLKVDEEEGGWAVARLNGGRRVRARVIVGADGNRSIARKYVQGGSQPQYVGASVWRFFCPGDNPFVEQGDSLVLTGDYKTLVMQPVKRDGEVLMFCAGISGFDEERLVELNQTRYIQASEEGTQAHRDKLARFAEALQDFNPDMVSYAVEHAAPESVLEHPMYSLDPQAPWVKGPVALVGDAVHTMPPNLGQGTPMAVEDAVQLAASLKKYSNTSTEGGSAGLPEGGFAAALKHYEAKRKPRVTPIWAESHRQAMSYYKERDSNDNPMQGSKSKAAEMTKWIANYSPPVLAELDDSVATV